MPAFFADLPPCAQPLGTFDHARYRSAPDGWAVVATDVVGSTQAIADGRQKAVNFVAAMAIAALKNLCAPRPIPFLFGGDGAIVLVPPGQADAARRVLARVRGMAARDYGLPLRVGLVPVAELRRLGGEVAVARYEPTPGNSFGTFLGGGVSMMEAAIKGRGLPELAALAAIDPALDDRAPVNLEGLSCRWDALRSRHGRMVSLIVQGAARPQEIFETVMRLAGQGGDPRAVRLDNLVARWPPKGFMLEARARRGRLPLWLSAPHVLLVSFVAWVLISRNIVAGGFDPRHYRQAIVDNTDFCKYDDTLCFVLDCALPGVDAIRAYLEECASSGQLRYGMDVSDTALMTCLVSSVTEDLHVHFVDGGGGGYTNAARHLKGAAQTTAAADLA